MSILEEMINDTTRSMQVSKVMELDIDDIERNPLNTAPMNYLYDLEELIKTNGIIEPLIVYKVGNHQYRLLAGERRYTIAKRLNYTALPTMIVPKPKDEVEEMLLISLHNVKRPDDTETMREKIKRLDEVASLKRSRGDEDMKGVRNTEWISQQLSGLSPRTVQEYLTGKYSEDALQTEDNKPKDEVKKAKLKTVVNQMMKLRKTLENVPLLEMDYNYKDLNDFEYECSELFAFLSRNGADILRAKKQMQENADKKQMLEDNEEQLTLHDFGV
ncbi:ParB N-terminal domain-containing protein [Erysipelothrix sp. HDW6A]|uniref:ParB/RepB/Spo0J family partition protein n=1 Tax=Erysipelothrix sp. HDW6A TaxID=2714928 RepID=UPI001409A13E|nr:ParB N-terminal domain-containing protein [Erysipelothrix sp. HDW6A]QIK56365.1 ParB N-terminal domain-containing protein [Erysipelothrix sp. HDW6A]